MVTTTSPLPPPVHCTTLEELKNEINNISYTHERYVCFTSGKSFFKASIDKKRTKPFLIPSSDLIFTIICDNSNENTCREMIYFVKYYSGNLHLNLCEQEDLNPVLNHFIYRLFIYDNLKAIRVDFETIKQPYLVMRVINCCKNIEKFTYVVEDAEKAHQIKWWFGNGVRKKLEIYVKINSDEIEKDLDLRGLLSFDSYLFFTCSSWNLNENNKAEVKQLSSRGYHEKVSITLLLKDFFYSSTLKFSLNDIYENFSIK